MTTTAQDPVQAPNVWPATLSLFTSAGTLICCALPAMLVSLGMGAVMASLVETVPGITWLGRHKLIVFAIAGSLILASGAWQWHARSLPCPADPAQARACTRLRRISWVIWSASLVFFLVGGFFAFFAQYVLL